MRGHVADGETFVGMVDRLFACLIPQMIVPYADAAALTLANLDRGSAMSHHRVGLALPVGMQGGSRSGRPKSIPQPHGSTCGSTRTMRFSTVEARGAGSRVHTHGVCFHAMPRVHRTALLSGCSLWPSLLMARELPFPGA